MTAAMVGRVAAVWRYPVKSMRGEEVDSTAVEERGVVGDRALALVDVETGMLASAKSPRLWPNLLEFSAGFVSAPAAGQPLPPIRITMPSGREVRTDDPEVEAALSDALGRRVRLVSENPAGAAVEQYLPAVEDADPEGGDFYREITNDVFGTGSLHDASPIHVLTTASLEHLGQLSPGSRFDVRRFRPNVVVEPTTGSGFVENGWVKRKMQLGGVRIRVTFPTLRCVMTTRPQGDLPKDLDVLRTPARHNRLPVLSLGSYPCVGVNGIIQAPGSIGRGDDVRFIGSPFDPAGEAATPGAGA